MSDQNQTQPFDLNAFQTFQTFEMPTTSIELEPGAELSQFSETPSTVVDVAETEVAEEPTPESSAEPAIEIVEAAEVVPEPEAAKFPTPETETETPPIALAENSAEELAQADDSAANVVEASETEQQTTDLVASPATEVLQPEQDVPVAAVIETSEPVEPSPELPANPDSPSKPLEVPVPEADIASTPEPATHSPKAAAKQTADRPAAKPVPVPGEITFRDLPLHEDVQRAIEQSGYEKPTEIQAQIIPHVLEGRDVLAQSQTGTGKTAAFALPILSRIDMNSRKPPQVLVLAPTRELAIQVANSFSTYGSCMPRFGVAAIYGGQDYGTQLRQLRDGVQVVVGTPGRVIDHVKRGTLDLSGIDCLVLDEADEMLNMGFLEDVQFVLDQTPAGRQVALFSATLPPPIRNIAQRYLNDPTRITIKNKTMTADSIRQRALFVPPRDKIETLVRILEVEETDGVIVFTKTREATVSVAEQLNGAGLSAVALNGDMAQRVRERTIEQLKSGQLDILVATDVAARGLDVTRISHVFNYDMPQDSESYIHRIGRTGRAGRKGEAVIFLTNNQRGKLRMIERATRQPIEVVQPPSADDINAMRVKRFTQRITDVTAEADLTIFKDIINNYATESGKPMDMIAAALAHIGQQGRPFFMKDRPARKRNERDDRRDDRGGRERFERDGRNRFDERPGRPSGGEGRRLGPPEPGMDRYRIEVGWRDGVKPGNIVGAVANEGGIDGDNIGPISIHDEYSTIDLPTGMPHEIFRTLQQTRVAGKQLRLSASRDQHSSPPRRNQGYRGGKPTGGPRGKAGGKFSKGRKFRK